MMKLFWQCLFSPRLYKIYKDGPANSLYQPQGPENWGSKIITSASTILNIGLYTSPVICFFIYRRGFFSLEETKSLARFFGSFGCLLAVSFMLRAYGRCSNPKYAEFLKAISSSKSDSKAYLSGIRKYDFEFQAWPVSFSMPRQERSLWLEKNPYNTTANADLPVPQRAIIQTLAFLATHIFGLRLIYPGSLAVIQTMLWMPLFQGRTVLVEDFNGQRAKLLTADGNTIDTMFVDKRNASPKGQILVICCEGNSGFYEFGIMTTPVKAGYSALGWNHPGFAGSSGQPYPSQEHNAIDAVVQYAIQELNFQPENILMFGWSIGGYSATWAAVNYPVKGLVLDATFDDLLPLAQNQMPASWALLVKEVVRSYVDLNIGALITKYNGPVQLVRRTEDEIICIKPGDISSNRGNHLLVQLIMKRHAKAFEDPQALVALLTYVGSLDTRLKVSERLAVEPYERPIKILIAKYLRDYRSSHCTPLPEQQFLTIMDTIDAIK